jgi:hypothetical protein
MRTARKEALLRVAAILVGAAALCTQARAGETSRGGTFLPLGWDARGAGLGGAATILVRDERSSYWNPANLTHLTDPRVSFGTTRLIEGLESRFSTLCVGAGLTEELSFPDSTFKWRRFAVALSASHLGLVLSEGSEWGEGALGFSAAYAISNYNSVGLTLRILKNWTDLENADASGLALDAGVTERLSSHTWFALAGKNVLNRVSYPDRKEQLDPVWNVALAYERLLGLISIECDAVLKNKVLNRFLTGIECSVAEDLFFVAGGLDCRLTEGERVIPSFGFGSSYRIYEVAGSFSFDPDEALGTQTRLSLSLIF